MRVFNSFIDSVQKYLGMISYILAYKEMSVFVPNITFPVHVFHLLALSD